MFASSQTGGEGRIESRPQRFGGRYARLARAGVAVLAASALVVGAVMFLTPHPRQAAYADCSNVPPPTPEPGPARPWEVDVPVSTYSQVNTRNGNLFTAIPVVTLPKKGLDLVFALYHNSANVNSPYDLSLGTGIDLGPGWSLGYSDQIVLNDYVTPTAATLIEDNGTVTRFTWDGDEWVAPAGVHDRLEQDGGTWRVFHKDQSYHEFVHRTWTSGGGGEIIHLTRVVGSLGDEARLRFDCEALGIPCADPPKLLRIEEGSVEPPIVRLEFDWSYDNDVDPTTLNRIVVPRHPSDPTDEGTIQDRYWFLSYGGGRLTEFDGPVYAGGSDPNPGTILFDYDFVGRITDMTDRILFGSIISNQNAYRFTYHADGRVDTVSDPDALLDPDDGLVQRFDATCCSGTTTTQYWDRRAVAQNPEGYPWEFVYNLSREYGFPYGNLERTKSPLVDARTWFTYDADRNVTEVADAVYNVWRSTYDDRGNRLTLTDPMGHGQVWTYDEFNNVTSYTDGARNTVTFEYNDPWPTLLTRIIEPPDGQGNPAAETLFDYYGGGLLREVTDPNGVVTHFEYDEWGQIATYREGDSAGQVAGAPLGVYESFFISDSGGRLVESYTRSSLGGTVSYNASGGATSSSCKALIAGGNGCEAADPPRPAGFPRTPTLPSPSGSRAWLVSGTYTPAGLPDTLQLNLVHAEGNVLQSDLRTITSTYDALNQLKSHSISSEEEGVAGGTFTYSYRWAEGITERTGPDGMTTIAQRDPANRVTSVVRGPSPDPTVNPALSASYTYHDPVNLVRGVTYGNGASVFYDYDNAYRLVTIEHRDTLGQRVLRMDYSYYDNDLPRLIRETEANGFISTVVYTYDTRGRLLTEVRTGQNQYSLAYEYDAGGNRTKKIAGFAQTETWYHYDLEDPVTYGSANNRLTYHETFDVSDAQNPVLLSTTWYYYTLAGNVRRVVTREEAGAGVMSARGALVSAGLDGAQSPKHKLKRGAGGCVLPDVEYTATRFEYACNGEAVTYVIGETWCADPDNVNSFPDQTTIVWGREFRYDEARQRYLNRPLEPDSLNFSGQAFVDDLAGSYPLSTIYDGNEAYADYQWGGGTPLRAFEPGIGRIEPHTTAGGENTDYYHTNHLGTTRAMTDPNGSAFTTAAYTAFGELVTGASDGESDRYGYVGEFGYQAHDEMPFLHVGARYYDPAIGRFLQRDPIGISAGTNVYVYIRNRPAMGVDPTGLIPLAGHNPNIPGDGPFTKPSRPPAPSPVNKPPPPGSAQDLRNQRRAERLKSVFSGAAIAACALTGPVGATAAALAAIIVAIHEGVANADDEAAGY